MIIAGCYIDIEFPERCTFELKGNDRNAQIQKSRKEKGKIFYYSMLTSAIITAITAFVFNLLAEPPYFIINISSVVLGIGGGIYLAIPILENVTYGDRFRMNPLEQRLLRQKRNAIFKLTGSFLIIWGLVLQLLYFMQR